MRLRTWWRTGMAALGGYMAYQALRSVKVGDYSGKIVLITGGSRGLGLNLARILVQQGAKLMLTARTEDQLIQAYGELQELTRDVFIFPADLRDPDSVKELVAETIRIFGRIDLLIHNAGVIDVGPYAAMRPADFESEMDIHFWAAVHLTQEIVPLMKTQNGGRIINISSFGGLVSVPHLLPYCSSKYALAGFSEGLGIELDQFNIKVLTVCPGLMRTGSVYNALFRGQPELEKTWFNLGASLPILSMNSRRAAKLILEASDQGDSMLVLTTPAKVAVRLHALFPNLWSTLMKRVNLTLPNQVDTIVAQPGSEVKDRLPRGTSVLTDRAARDNNELAS